MKKALLLIILVLLVVMTACGEKDTRKFILDNDNKYYEAYESVEFGIYKLDKLAFASEIQIFHEDDEYTYHFSSMRHGSIRIVISDEVYTIAEILELKLVSYDDLNATGEIGMYRTEKWLFIDSK